MASGYVKNEPVFVLELNAKELETIRILTANAHYITDSNIAFVDLDVSRALYSVVQKLKNGLAN